MNLVVLMGRQMVKESEEREKAPEHGILKCRKGRGRIPCSGVFLPAFGRLSAGNSLNRAYKKGYNQSRKCGGA